MVRIMCLSPWKRRLTTYDIETGAGQKEIFASWSLFILIMLLIVALFTSYVLQTRRIQAVHETVISIFAGMRTPAIADRSGRVRCERV